MQQLLSHEMLVAKSRRPVHRCLEHPVHIILHWVRFNRIFTTYATCCLEMDSLEDSAGNTPNDWVFIAAVALHCSGHAGRSNSPSGCLLSTTILNAHGAPCTRTGWKVFKYFRRRQSVTKLFFPRNFRQFLSFDQNTYTFCTKKKKLADDEL